MALLQIALLPLLLAVQPQHGGHELDVLPDSVRSRATLIFTGTYITRPGPAIRRGNMEIFPLVGAFRVRTTFLGQLPESVRIDLGGHDVSGGRTYLVLLRPQPESWTRIEGGDRTELTDDEVVSIIYLPPHAERVDITDFGTFAAAPERDPRLDAPNTSLGYVHTVDALETPVVTEHTELVRGFVGQRFGLLFCAEGQAFDDAELEQSDDVASIHIRVLHPPTNNPLNGKVTDHDEWDAPANLGIIRFTGWRFDSEWEIVPGTWTIEIMQNGTVMARKEFLVTSSE
jgi:hypothetical protein